MASHKLNFFKLGPLVSLMFAGFSTVAQGSEADWKLYGATKTPDENVTCFYDVKGIKTSADGNLKVWTKCITNKALDLDKMTAEHRDEMIKEAAKNLVISDPPPYTKKHKVDKDLLIDILANEAIANSGYADPKTKALFEINCEGKMSRYLSFSIYKDGQYHSNTKPEEWTDIAPDSMSSSLSSLACPSK